MIILLHLQSPPIFCVVVACTHTIHGRKLAVLYFRFDVSDWRLSTASNAGFVMHNA